MANEVTVLELGPPRLSNTDHPTMPAVDKQVLDATADTSDAFEESTVRIGVYTTSATNIDIRATPADETKFPIPANSWHYFDVLPGHKIGTFS
jgi:hypothetical protein